MVFVVRSGHGIWGRHHFHVIKVKVTGSAAWGFWGIGGRSFSTAYATIVPKGWWWAF